MKSDGQERPSLFAFTRAYVAAYCSLVLPNLYDFGDLRRFPTLTATTDFFATRYAGFADLDAYLSGYAITGDALRTLAVPSR